MSTQANDHLSMPTGLQAHIHARAHTLSLRHYEPCVGSHNKYKTKMIPGQGSSRYKSGLVSSWASWGIRCDPGHLLKESRTHLPSFFQDKQSWQQAHLQRPIQGSAVNFVGIQGSENLEIYTRSRTKGHPGDCFEVKIRPKMTPSHSLHVG